jgi:hypothetical protein
VRTANLPEGFLPRGFHTEIVIVIGLARAHGVLFEVGVPFEPTIPTHDSPCLSGLLKYFGGHLESLKSLKQQHNVAEKAGVGGSTPSLATIILTNLAESRLVRSQSAVFRRDPVRFLAAMMVKDLTSNCPSLSPLSVRFCLRRG